MHHENSSLACNDWVIDDDATINSHLDRRRERLRPLMQTLIMGLAGLAGKVTDSYPALDVKAGIILDVCSCMHVEVEGGAARIHRWASWNH